MNLTAFYHVYLTEDVLTYNIFSEQLYALTMSGLLQKLKKLHIGIIGGDKNQYQRIIDSYNLDKNIQIIYTKETGDERDTAVYMKKFCDEDKKNSYVLYLHTKSSSHVNRIDYLQTKYWRHMMEYYTIMNWKSCVEKLEEGYDSSGCLYHGNHYSGNIWWFKSSLLKKIDKVYLSSESPFGLNAIEFIPMAVDTKAFSFDDDPWKRMNMYVDIHHPKNYISFFDLPKKP